MDAGNVLMKVVFTGQSNSGKTTLIHWETERVIPDFQATVGIDFKKKTYQISEITAQVLLWDTDGGERFMRMKGPLYRNSHAICLCFSLNDRYSFERVPTWTKVLRLNQIECPLFLVGCKADLEHVITAEEIKEYAIKEGMTYFETSAKQDTGVANNIQHVMEAAFDYFQQNPQVRLKSYTKPVLKTGFCWS